MVYIIPLCIIIFCIYWYDYLENNRRKDLIYYGLMTYFILISGLSYRIGIDIVNFYEQEFYEKYPTLDRVSIDYIFYTEGRQPGWLLFASACKSILADFNFMKTIIAFIVNVSIFHTIRRYTKNIFTGVLTYVLFLYPYFSFEILRESMAIAVLLYSLKYLEDFKYSKYYLGLFIAFMFHESSSFAIIFPFISSVKFTKKKVYLLAALALAIMIFQSYFSFIPEFFSKIPMFSMKAERYINSEFFSQYRTYSLSQFYTHILNVFIPILGIYYIRINRNSSESNIFNKDKYIIVYLFISVFSAFFPIMFRCDNYVSIFFYIYMMELMCYIADWITPQPLVRTIVCAIFILYNIIPQYFAPQERFAGFPPIVKIYPYTSIIDKETIPEREIMYYNFFNQNK